MKTLLELFWVFFKISAFTFGGGYAMIPGIKDEVITKKGWISEEEMLDIIAIAESTPGPIAINTATYIGYKKKKILGSVFATIGVVLPPLVIMFIISLFFEKIVDNKYISYALKGINGFVAFLITKTGIDMFKKLKKNTYSIVSFSVVTFLILLFFVLDFNFSSIYFCIAGGLINIILCSIFKQKEGEIK